LEGLKGTSACNEISKLLILRTPLSGQKPFEGSNPSLRQFLRSPPCWVVQNQELIDGRKATVARILAAADSAKDC
jgi:hypothetical protein